MASKIMKQFNINDCSFGHLTLILSLHYLVKCRSCSLVINEFILDCTCISSENQWDHKIIQICNSL